MPANLLTPNTPSPEVEVFASAARTATPTDVYFATRGKSSLALFIKVTAAGMAPSVTFTIKGYDPATGATWDILSSAALTTVGSTVLRVHPALSVVANEKANDVLPAYVLISAQHANADSITYQAVAHLGA